MIFPLSFVFYLLIHMSCSSKTDCFVTFQVTLLLKLCRLYQRKHISQKCLRSTLWTAHLPRSNLKWRTTFSNILSELHMDISQTQDWAAEGALNSPSALHSAHHWCLTHSKIIWPKKAIVDETSVPEASWTLPSSVSMEGNLSDPANIFSMFQFRACR